MSLQVFRKIRKLYTFENVVQKDGRHIQTDDLSFIEDAAMITSGGQIFWVGKEKDYLSALKEIKLKLGKKKSSGKINYIDLNYQTVFPSFVESHTHLVFAGDRRSEFEKRNQGIKYEQIAREGGGILNTVTATQKANPKMLIELAQTRANQFVRQGVTTIEAKSGYGLDEKTELKILAVHKKIMGPRIVSTYLGAHAVPAGRLKAEYLNEMIKSTLPQIIKKKLATRIDIYIEKSFYDFSDADMYFQAAKDSGFDICAHVDQLSPLGGAEYMLKHNPRSLEHCVFLKPESYSKLGQAETTFVLLPTSDFYLKMAYPNARALIDAGARVALATDFNPGTSPTQDLSFVGVLARLHMHMTWAEVFAAYTFNAAKALGFNFENNIHLGALLPGFQGDFVVSSADLEDYFYQVGTHPVSTVYKDARILNGN
jgi:imidazolonepropionase